MVKIKQPFVIAIAAVSGGGKTTIVTELTKRLPNSTSLHFDDYDFEGPKDVIQWVDGGVNYNDWNLTPLIRDIEKLLGESLEFIVLDYPFGYKHPGVSRLIDLAVFVDTPLDIAMARRIIRDYQDAADAAGTAILENMTHYLSHGRRGYLESLKSVKPSSDIVIDGCLSLEEMINLLVKMIND